MQVECEISEEVLENDNGYPVEGTIAECTECGHRTESFGTSTSSVKRCLALMREECPNKENNFYISD